MTPDSLDARAPRHTWNQLRGFVVIRDAVLSVLPPPETAKRAILANDIANAVVLALLAETQPEVTK